MSAITCMSCRSFCSDSQISITSNPMPVRPSVMNTISKMVRRIFLRKAWWLMLLIRLNSSQSLLPYHGSQLQKLGVQRQPFAFGPRQVDFEIHSLLAQSEMDNDAFMTTHVAAIANRQDRVPVCVLQCGHKRLPAEFL